MSFYTENKDNIVKADYNIFFTNSSATRSISTEDISVLMADTEIPNVKELIDNKFKDDFKKPHSIEVITETFKDSSNPSEIKACLMLSESHQQLMTTGMNALQKGVYDAIRPKILAATNKLEKITNPFLEKLEKTIDNMAHEQSKPNQKTNNHKKKDEMER